MSQKCRIYSKPAALVADNPTLGAPCYRVFTSTLVFTGVTGVTGVTALIFAASSGNTT
jgi:hypothetical protein